MCNCEEPTRRLKKVLMESGLTIEEFAKQCKVSRSAMKNYLDGRLPQSDQLINICKACNVSADWLLGLSDVKSTSADISTVVKTLGITEEAVNTIIDLYGKERGPSLSRLIEHESFLLLVNDYTDFLRCLDCVKSDPLFDQLGTVIEENGTLSVKPYEAAVLMGNQVVMDLALITNEDRIRRLEELGFETNGS